MCVLHVTPVASCTILPLSSSLKILLFHCFSLVFWGDRLLHLCGMQTFWGKVSLQTWALYSSFGQPIASLSNQLCSDAALLVWSLLCSCESVNDTFFTFFQILFPTQVWHEKDLFLVFGLNLHLGSFFVWSHEAFSVMLSLFACQHRAHCSQQCQIYFLRSDMCPPPGSQPHCCAGRQLVWFCSLSSHLPRQKNSRGNSAHTHFAFRVVPQTNKDIPMVSVNTLANRPSGKTSKYHSDGVRQ